MTNKIFNNMLVVGFISIFLTIFLTAGVFFTSFENQIENDVKLETETIATAIESGADINSFTDDSLRLTLVEADGTVSYDNQADVSTLENHLSRPEIQDALKNGEGQTVRKSSTMDKTNYYFAILLKTGNILRVSVTTYSIFLIFCKSFWYLAIVALVVIFISLALAYALTKKIVKPIEKMGNDLDHIDENCAYEELKPFSDKIHKQLEDKEKLSKMKKQFTANVSHELKTPLTSISGYGEMLENGMVKPEDVADIGKIINKESHRLINLTNDIIQLSQLEEYDFKPIIDSVDLLSISKSCVDALSLVSAKRNVDLHLEGESAKVRGTKSLLEDLIYNLIDNAIRYNIPNGDVYISVKDNDAFAEITIRDTGIGIPKKYQERVFERFFRVDKSRSKETGGTGLGLAIVKHTVDYLGGKLTLVSDEGVGTTISIKLYK